MKKLIMTSVIATMMIAGLGTVWGDTCDSPTRPRYQRRAAWLQLLDVLTVVQQHHRAMPAEIVPGEVSPVEEVPLFEQPPVPGNRNRQVPATPRFEQVVPPEPVPPAPVPSAHTHSRHTRQNQFQSTSRTVRPRAIPHRVLRHQRQTTGPVFERFRPGQIVDCAVPLYRHVKLDDVHNMAPGAVPVIVAVRDPVDFRGNRCVFVKVYAPNCPPRRVRVSDHGTKVRLDYGKYDVEIEVEDGCIEIEYND